MSLAVFRKAKSETPRTCAGTPPSGAFPKRKNTSTPDFVWREVDWRRPIEPDSVVDLLSNIATTHPRGFIVWEARNKGGKTHYLLGTEPQMTRKIERIFHAHGDVRFKSAYQHPRMDAAGVTQIRTSKKLLSLNTDVSMSVLRSALAALSNTRDDEELIVQVMLGQSYSPAPVSGGLQDPHATWLDIITGSVKKASGETMRSVRTKAAQHSFDCVIRIGSTSKNNYLSPMYDLVAAFKIMQAAGVKVYTANETPEKLNTPHVPWSFPMRLSAKELSNFLLLPIGEEELPGADALHPKATLPPEWYKEPRKSHEDRTFALSLDGKKLSIPPKDAAEHVIITGPTGAGKSTVMLNLILSDIRSDRGILLIDPKQELVDSVLERIPQRRHKDVVVLDATSPNPVGFNPLDCSKGQDKALVADTLLSVLKEVFAESWGIRTQDLLNAAIQTLVDIPGANMMWLPELFTNDSFRQKITANVTDEIALKPFWRRFEELSPNERRQICEPVLNKLRNFLLRPRLRDVLGQSKPTLDLNELFTTNKIILVPLNKGVIGGECAKFLGSLIVGLTWAYALGRACVPEEERGMVSLYIDELQDYLQLPNDLSDALAQARSMNLSVSMAHQFRDQLPPKLKAGIDANARNKIVFSLGGGDARETAALAPGLEPLDFTSLMRYHIYANLQNYGMNTGWIQGETLPKPPMLQSAAELRAISMERYGVPAEQVEAELAAAFQIEEPSSDEMPEGRKRSGYATKHFGSFAGMDASDFRPTRGNKKRKEDGDGEK